MSAAVLETGSAPGRTTQAAPSRRLRLAYVITGLELGGGSAVVLTLARALDRERFDLDVYCVLAGGDMEAELHRLGYKVRILPWAYDYRRRLLHYSPTKTWQLASLLREGNYDVVHTHLFQADTIGRVAARLARVPVIVKSLHNMGRWKTRGQVAVDRFLNRWTDKVICCSDYQREIAAAQEGFKEQASVTIPHGVALRRFPARIDRAALLASLQLRPDFRTIGTVGRTIAEKGQMHLVEAVPAVLQSRPKTQFLIVGDGSMRGALESRVAELGHQDRVRFIGAREDIPELMSVMDIFAFPSLSEGFGIAPLEAMATGIPVVASRIRPLTEIIRDPESGLLVEPRNATALADALNMLLASDSLRAQMGRYGRALVEDRYTDTHMVEAHQDLYLALHHAAVTHGKAQDRTAIVHDRNPERAPVGPRVDA